MQSYLLKPRKSIFPISLALFPGSRLISNQLIRVDDVPDPEALKRKCILTTTSLFQILYEGELDPALNLHSPANILNRKGGSLHRLRSQIKGKLETDKYLYFYEDRALILENQLDPQGTFDLNRFRSERHYCDGALMGAMFVLHANHQRCSIENLVDPFLGKGGTLLAALKYGVRDTVGIEVMGPHFEETQLNFEQHLRDELSPYVKKREPQSVVYELQDSRRTRIQIFFGNSLSDGPSFIRDSILAEREYEIVTDMPWGAIKCPAVHSNGVSSKEDMNRFYRETGEMLERLGSPRITVAQNRYYPLGRLNKIASVDYPQLVSIVMYTLSI